uniref:Uncharacterized protein n=1 Tax=Amphimedon queenslandica TaxID=400682 RepID=A0A1X7T6C1_AMPQE
LASRRTYIPVEERQMVKVADMKPTTSGSSQSVIRFILLFV